MNKKNKDLFKYNAGLTAEQESCIATEAYICRIASGPGGDRKPVAVEQINRLRLPPDIKLAAIMALCL